MVEGYILSLVAAYVTFGEVQAFCLFLKIQFLDVHQILTWSQVYQPIAFGMITEKHWHH